MEGPSVIADRAADDAVISPPPPMPIQTFAELNAATRRAEPFSDVEFTQRHFCQRGDVVVITYEVQAKHKRFRRRYLARCSSTYVREENHWLLLAHNHVRL